LDASLKFVARVCLSPLWTSASVLLGFDDAFDRVASKRWKHVSSARTTTERT
jgi:hypothetical protein